jgi:succinate-semialdehyde dehydrogenase/glutarate-semialdehyde dehydrogenase
MINAVNPATEEIISTYSFTTPNQLNQILSTAKEGFKTWSNLTIKERAHYILELADQLEKKAQDFGRLISNEMGKPIQEAIAEVQKSASACRFFAQHADEFLKDKNIDSDVKLHYQPLGTILGIMPWNFPFWQTFRFLAPTLMAGNCILIKPALNTPGCAQAIENLVNELGFPKGICQVIFLPHEDIPDLIAESQIKGVSLTGSDRAGRQIAESAGKHLKKVLLELGGSDPFIVCKDADLKKAVAGAVKGRLINAGQSCIAAKRFIIHKSILSEFTKLLVDEVKNIKIGDPLDLAIQMGPLARKDLVENLMKQVSSSIKQGAKVVLEGKSLDRKGCFVTPTILTNVRKDMTVFKEETFGPVFALMSFENEDEAIEIANGTEYGLGASIWTKNKDQGLELAKKIESGLVFINEIVASDPKYPFGGIKNSGFGKELSEEGIKEFVNLKTIKGI